MLIFPTWTAATTQCLSLSRRSKRILQAVVLDPHIICQCYTNASTDRCLLKRHRCHQPKRFLRHMGHCLVTPLRGSPGYRAICNASCSTQHFCWRSSIQIVT